MSWNDQMAIPTVYAERRTVLVRGALALRGVPMAFRMSRDRSIRSALLVSSSAIAAAGFAATASAQDATETVVVTGSRIPQTGLYSSSPVTAVGQQEMKLTGSTSIEQTLRMLPSAVADVDNQFTNNASAGENNIDLRGLG